MLEKNNDNYNLQRLYEYRLPVIKSINHLLELFDLKDRERWYFFSANRKSHYKTFKIPKKGGGERIIEAPTGNFKAILKAIDSVFFRHFMMPRPCCAFCGGRSIVDNAIPHIGAATLLKFDIHDFFPSIDLKRVVYLFRHFGYGYNVSRYLGFLCTNPKNVLPQGSPTSPMISNFVSVRLDSRIAGFCKKHAEDLCLTYTRYADDITISSKKRLSDKDILFVKKVIECIIIDEGFEPNYEKYKCYTIGQKMMVTGIVINDTGQIRVDKKKIREIENAIRYIERYGIKSHVEHINKKYNKKWTPLKYERHIFGLAFYIKMIDDIKGKQYISSLKRALNNDEQ